MTAALLHLLARIRTIESRFGINLAPVPPPRTARGAPGAFGDIIESAARRYGLDPALVRAIIEAESGFNPQATSPRGAAGLMQLMPATQAALGVRNPYDPAQNVEAGVRYLAGLVRRFGDVAIALAAYNAGPNAVQRYGGIPPYAETRAYVNRVLETWKALRATPAEERRDP